MKVSIVIPVYNVISYLEKCVESVVEQTFSNIEIILVDDGSTDGSGALCDEYIRRDSRIKVIHKTNGGLSDARNTGAEISTGDYIYFLDSDDWIEKNAIEVLAGFANENDLDIVSFDARIVDENGLPINNISSISRYYRNKIYPKKCNSIELFRLLIENNDYYSAVPLLFIKKSVMTIKFEPILHEDELFTPTLMYSSVNAGHCPYRLYVRRIRADSITTMPKGRKHFLGNAGAALGLMSIVNRDMALNTRINELCDRAIELYKRLPKADQKETRSVFASIKKTKRSVETSKMYKTLYRFYELLPKPLKKYVKAVRFRVDNLHKWPAFKNTLLSHYRVVILAGTPIHGNLGDHAIAIAEENMLKKHLPDYFYMEMTMPFYKKNFKKIQKIIRPSDLLFISGGGWMGNQWLHNELIIRDTVAKFKRNTITIFPQTIFYKDFPNTETQIKLAEQVYSKAHNSYFFLRDEASYRFAVEHQFVNFFIAPDMALFLGKQRFRLHRNGVLISKRDDVEKNLPDEFWSLIVQNLDNRNIPYFFSNTVINHVSEEMRNDALIRKLEEFSTYELIITDRLHSMLFAALTETPCLAFDNSSKKVSGVFKWIENLGYVKVANGIDEANKYIDELLSFENPIYLMPDFSVLENFIDNINKREDNNNG